MVAQGQQRAAAVAADKVALVVAFLCALVTAALRVEREANSNALSALRRRQSYNHTPVVVVATDMVVGETSCANKKIRRSRRSKQKATTTIYRLFGAFFGQLSNMVYPDRPVRNIYTSNKRYKTKKKTTSKNRSAILGECDEKRWRRLAFNGRWLEERSKLLTLKTANVQYKHVKSECGEKSWQ